jgi:ribonucleotide monophosphatase NagD (HAD superfamily)
MSFPASLIPSDDVFTSLDAARRLFPSTSSGSSPLLLLSQSAQEPFKDLSGAFHAKADRLPSELNAEEREKLRACDAVVMGLAPGLMRYEWLDEAFRLLSGEYGSKRVSLIGTHRALYHRPGGKGKDGAEKQPLSLGPGAFLAALEEGAGLDRKDTVTVGKPQWTFFEECLKGMGWDPDTKTDKRDGKDEVWIVSD